ncbi:YHYH protein [Algibacillus agarilyticus]|uniref:YHYH protein n=1 Tax=Algibacillus agarilyticus TaxID=2234133 RepID=UPI000DD0DDA0|nr:YHYH protein [Algibacillus agarilyticus]
MRLLIMSIFLVFSITACGGSGTNNTLTDTDVENGDGTDNTSDGSSGDNNSGNADNSGGNNSGGDGSDTGSDTGSGGDTTTPVVNTQPNILILISDDQGKDTSAQYPLYSNDLPTTPNINQLAEQGIVFDNAWATPMCATTRAAILTGQYGIHSGITQVPGDLNTTTPIIASMLSSSDNANNYQTGFFGKWHLAGNGSDLDHPNKMGIDYFAGTIQGNIDDYYNWDLTINGELNKSTEYHTSKITDLAIDWIDKSDTTKPWLVWMAYSAPHSPFHLPPASLHNRNLSGTTDDIENNTRQYFLAAIEALDSEVGRLVAEIPTEQLANTIIFYIGDNGTPKKVIDTTLYAKAHSKSTLFEGGVNVPFIVSGQKVTRKNQRESALINSTDIMATLAEIANIPLTTQTDSNSFAHLLTTENASHRDYLFTSIDNSSDANSGYAIRNQNYKLISYKDGTEAFYDLSQSPIETTDLLSQANFNSTNAAAIYQTLKNQLNILLGQTPTGDIDITNATLTKRSNSCADYLNNYTSSVLDVNEATMFNGDLRITLTNTKCVFNTNAIPNHDFNDGSLAFPNSVSAQDDLFEITSTPTKAATATELSLNYDNAILLNGVKVDVLAAGCFGIGNGKIGCNDMATPWRYDPMFAANNFRVDTHNAHAQPDGTYHYHGTPNAFYTSDDLTESPVIGFAADGFPIFGPNFNDNGVIRKAKPSYELKAGSRPAGNGEPGGTYDGTFRDDWQYTAGLGDLDACNGMTLNGVYGYYITDSYPYIIGCYTGTPDESFRK